MHAWHFMLHLDPIAVNWCIKCWPWSKIIVERGWHELWDWWNTRHCNSTPNSFHQQGSIKCYVVLLQYRKRSPWDTIQPREFWALLFYEGYMHHCWSQAIGGNIQQGCGHTFPTSVVHHVVHSPIYGMHYEQAWPRPVHSRLVIVEQPYRKQGLGTHWHEHK